MQLPYERVYVNTGDPIEEENLIEFRLLYEGELPGNNATARDKQAVRRQFHPQLRRVWRWQPTLRSLLVRIWHRWRESQKINTPVPQTLDEQFEVALTEVGRNWNKGNHNFIPIVTEDLVLRCSLDVLLLRPGASSLEGNKYIYKQGDLDNQVATLLDGLKIPLEAAHVGYPHPFVDEDPFYCLLTDDRLVSEIRVYSDELLMLADRFVSISDRDNSEIGLKQMLDDPNSTRNLSGDDKSAISAAIRILQKPILRASDVFAVIHVRLNHKFPRTFDNYFG